MGRLILGKGNCASCKYRVKLTRQIWFCTLAKFVINIQMACNMGDYNCDFWRPENEILHDDMSEEN